MNFSGNVNTCIRSRRLDFGNAPDYNRSMYVLKDFFPSLNSLVILKLLPMDGGLHSPSAFLVYAVIITVSR